MIGLDTNILIRYITQDDDAQADLARELIENQCSSQSPAYINLVVLCELVWVLSSAYEYVRSQICVALQQLLVTDCFEVEEHALAWDALRDYRAGTADYADCVIARLNRKSGAVHTYTFDKRAGSSAGFVLLTDANP